jgi:nicotinate-nucleotide adenylyltransferase
MNRRRIGIFGGTFDPPHLGHLIAAQQAAELLRLDRVLFIPAGRPPHKRQRATTTAADRLAMVKLAIAANPLFGCSDLELRSPGASYTVDTLELLARSRPPARLHLLIGLDQAELLPTWRQPEKLFALATICVLQRPGFSFARIPQPWRGRVVPVPVSSIGISASDIRRRVARHRRIDYLVTPAVARYIRRHRLYLP